MFMKYFSTASSFSKNKASIKIKDVEVFFGIIPEEESNLPNPAELFLGSLSACILKNVERFSHLMNFKYSSAKISITTTRHSKPPSMEEINYELIIYSEDNDLNINLLQKNIEKFGTIYNTAKKSCRISGKIKKIQAPF